MPQVPRLQTPTVNLSAGPNVQLSDNVSSEAFGFGPSAQKVLETGRDLFVKAQENADKMAARDNDRMLSELENQLLYDPEKGALNLKGKDSFTSIQDVDTKFREGFSKLETSLSNDYQKSLLRQSFENRRVEVERTLQKHVSREIESYDNEQTKAFVQTETDAVIADPTNFSRVRTAVDRQRQALLEFADRRGLSAESTKQLIEESAGETHSAAIRALLNRNDDITAKSYFDAVAPEIKGKQLLSITKELEDGVLRGKSQRMAAKFYTGDNLKEALEQARSLDPKLQDETVDRIKKLHNEYETVRKDRIEKMHINATNIIDATGSVDKIPREVWSQFTTAERTSLENYAKKSPETDLKVWYDLRTMSSTPGLREQFKSIDLYSGFINKLGREEFKELARLQDGLRKGDPKALKLADGIRSDIQIVNDNLKDMGVNLSAKAGTTDAKRANAYRLRMDQWVSDYAQKTGKRPTNDEIDKQAKFLMGEVVINKRSFWWDETKRNYELKPGETALDVSEVPDSERSKIEEALKRNRQPVNEQTIRDAYLLKINRGAERASK